MVVFANIPICNKISSRFEIFFFDKLSSNDASFDKVVNRFDQYDIFVTFAYQDFNKWLL